MTCGTLLKLAYVALARCRWGRTLAIIAALGVAVIITFAGVAIGLAASEAAQQNLQAAADQYARTLASTNATMGTASNASLARLGIVGDGADMVIRVNRPPSKGSYIGNKSVIEVIIQRHRPWWFVGTYLQNSSIMSARSVVQSGSAVLLE